MAVVSNLRRPIEPYLRLRAHLWLWLPLCCIRPRRRLNLHGTFAACRYQGENSLCYDAGNSVDRSGYACMMQTLVSSWRKVWSATPGTTDPLAPFGIASLADGTDEGFGVNMRAFRWAQTANYGHLPNKAMPRTFLADSFDLGDPWHTPNCATNGTFGGAPFDGQHCCVDKSHPLGPQCKGDHRGEWAMNETRYWAGLGTLHPRMKLPLGKRLAQGLHATQYNGSMPASQRPSPLRVPSQQQQQRRW